MATILSSKKSSVGSPYAYYTVEAFTLDRTPVSVKVDVKITTRLATSVSFFGKGKGLKGEIYVGGKWHSTTIKTTDSSWSGTTEHTASMTFKVSGLLASTSALTGIKFRVVRTDDTGSACKLNAVSCKNIAVTKVSSKYSAVIFNADTEGITQKQVKATLSGIPKAVGFATTIKWYKDNTHVASTSVSAKTTATAFAYTFTGLLPNTSYALKAYVYYGSTLLVSKSVTIVTPQETGVLTIKPQATYIESAVSGMFNNPNYTRSIEIYYKKDEENDYKLFSTEATQGTDISKNITGLLSNSVYDIKAVVKNGTTTLVTLTDRIETLEDTSLIPTAMIEQITQQLGTRLCTIEWVTSKSVAGTAYVVEAKREEETEWKEFAQMSEVISPVTIELDPEDMGNTNVNFRIKSTNISVAEETTNYSEVVTFYVRDEFLWDYDKIAGNPLIITANEWNRLGEYVIARNKDVGNIVEIAKVSKDDEIKASDYNLMKNLILKAAGQNELMILGQSVLGKSKLIARDQYIRNKKRGDTIVATEIDALRVSINNIS